MNDCSLFLRAQTLDKSPHAPKMSSEGYRLGCSLVPLPLNWNMKDVASSVTRTLERHGVVTAAGAAAAEDFLFFDERQSFLCGAGSH